MYSTRSRAFLKSYSLACLLSSQMYNCTEEHERFLKVVRVVVIRCLYLILWFYGTRKKLHLRVEM